MATASTSGQSPFGLGRKKRAPGLLDQIGRFFGGDKKRKGKVSQFLFYFFYLFSKHCYGQRQLLNYIYLNIHNLNIV
uniref:Uncharacterized protein n=1 Tax=Sinocyclocheilus anshuiensis TaxID=1608454 RepID=A0A671MKH0_9TELE